MVDGFYKYTTNNTCGVIRLKGGRITETAPIFRKMKTWSRSKIFMNRNKMEKLKTKVLVCGGRDFDDCVFLYRQMDKIDKLYNIYCVVEGDAKGTDKMAGKWGRFRKKEVKVYPAKWKKFGKRAGPIRNLTMLEDNSDIELVISFPGGNDTRNMVDKAREKKIAVYDLRFNYEKE
jgi:hypothetical protein